MDYEKKYKEMKARVREIGQGYVKGVDFSKPRQIAEYICPELVEIEDEKMLRVLREGFKILDKDDEWYSGITNGQILAWLEKQSAQEIKKKPIWKHWKNGIAGNGEGKQIYLIKSGDSYTLSSCLGYECDYIELSDLDEFMLSEKQDKNHADKVEPKFKVGDWVACNTKDLRYLLRIVSISDKEYRTEDIQGVSARPKIWYLDKYYHLWTIQDAKDGDVLTDGSCIFIIKKLNQDSIAEIYCCLFDDGDFELNSSLMFAETSTYPATKEQRDMLFLKMYKAGYEWEPERKELRELGQLEATSDSVTQQSPLVDTAKAFLQALSDTPYNNTPVVEAQFAVKQLLTFLSDPKAYDPDAINTHKSAEWSEEDEAMYQGVIETEQYMLDVVYGRKIFLVGNESIKEECAKELAWLNSLRLRNQWKPSAEDIECIDNVIKTLHKFDYNTPRKETSEQILWLESLKQRCTCNPLWSEKDEKLLELSLENLTELKNRFGEEYGKVGDCIYWLKSLKDRIK